MKSTFAICSIALFLISCVSVQLPTGKSQPAKGVSWSSPGSPFKEINTPQIDHSWQSTTTGNSISYFSSCGNTADPGLEVLEADALSALTDLEVHSSEVIQFNGRAGRNSVAKGQIDGIPMQLAVLVFKKNNCNYTLTFGGLSKNFETELPFFQKFKESFKAP